MLSHPTIVLGQDTRQRTQMLIEIQWVLDTKFTIVNILRSVEELFYIHIASRNRLPALLSTMFTIYY